MFIRYPAVAVFLSALLAASAVRAADPFVYTVTTTTGTPETFSFGGHRIVNLTDDLILGTGRGAAASGRDLVATLKYAGVPDAIRITLNADRTGAVVVYPRSGGHETFTASANTNYGISSAAILDDKVFDSITDSGNKLWENLQRELNRQSFIMPADGNPSAATDVLADASFRKYALVRDDTPAGGDVVYGIPPGGPQVWFDVGAGPIRTEGFNGYDVRGSVNALGEFFPYAPPGPNLGYSVSIPFQYRNIDGTDASSGAVEFGLPIRILDANVPRNRGLGWTVSPFFELGASDSTDLGSTVALFGVGAASRLSFTLPDRYGGWTFAVGNQFSAYFDLGAFDDNGYDDGYYGSYGYDYGDDEAFNGQTSQQLVKNAVQIVRGIGSDVSLDVSLTYTSTLSNAAVDDFFTPAIGVAWRIDRYLGLRFGYRADLANHYNAQIGDFSITGRF